MQYLSQIWFIILHEGILATEPTFSVLGIWEVLIKLAGLEPDLKEVLSEYVEVDFYLYNFNLERDWVQISYTGDKTFIYSPKFACLRKFPAVSTWALAIGCVSDAIRMSGVELVTLSIWKHQFAEFKINYFFHRIILGKSYLNIRNILLLRWIYKKVAVLRRKIF